MDNVYNDLTTPLGLLKNQMYRNGKRDLETVAEALYQQKNSQLKAGLYSQHRFTSNGSDCETELVDSFTGTSKNCILWCINHYTGLNRNENVIKKSCEAIKKFGTSSGTSAISAGMSSLHKEIEKRMAKFTGKEAALLFPTGYTTNLGIISALPQKHDLILFDREAHASIIDGVKLSNAKWQSFRHNNVIDLEKKLQKSVGRFNNIFVLVESAYSMSGDLSPLVDIVALKNKYPFYLYVDEAHTLGIYGDKGAGYCNELGVTEQVDFLMSTLSKSMASIGGFVACKEKYIPFIEWSTNAFLFQACLTPGDAAAILASLDELENNPSIIKRLHEKNRYMRERLKDIGFDLGNSQSPIIPIFIKEPKTLLNFNRELFNNGIFSISIVYPIVKSSEGRIRFILNTSHSYAQIDKTLMVLEKLGKKFKLFKEKAVYCARA